ncbi:prepilin-type N-terminal cleavage/methylation domain-containing protein [Desulfatitalea alkaliphila]|uniref:Prepilin-type N-terminal cleavage/methylation domain-containing protein n=1 Tax=Desulfatitalea alkaliphila TaxID=2929485 RepID=A0AA41UK61_9BACT|nr:prepilin-type N-terminal cleavage/methylation domain-containing protein [Desulfatitalea alkaliphila]MCJ8501974.1 prepilin-type N-terminal cleavage/methylation domain-containing protein [Desulfatitalea alkaliphila]
MTAPAPAKEWCDQRGFTLIEILFTIIISAILTVILAQVISEQTWRSYQPVQTLDDSLLLNAVMNNVVADYRHLQRDPVQKNPLITLCKKLNSGVYWQNDHVVPSRTKIVFNPRNVALEPSGIRADDIDNCESLQGLLQVIVSIPDTSQNLTALFGR